MSTWVVVVVAVPLLGLVMGFSPTLYGICFLYLVKGAPGRRAVVWVSAGLALGCTLLFGLYQFADASVISTYLTSHVRQFVVQRYVDLAAGVLLLASAALLAARSHKDRTSKVNIPSSGDGEAAADKSSRDHDDCSPRTAAALGFTNAYFGSSGFATMYIVARVISTVSPHPLVHGLVYLAFIPTLVGPYLLLAWGWARWPGMATSLTQIYDRIVHRDYHKLLVVGLLIAGLIFLVLGVRGMIIHR